MCPWECAAAHGGRESKNEGFPYRRTEDPVNGIEQEEKIESVNGAPKKVIIDSSPGKVLVATQPKYWVSRLLTLPATTSGPPKQGEVPVPHLRITEIICPK